LQSRDPFSGDCDRSSGESALNWADSITSLQSRDPFSGDCDDPLGRQGPEDPGRPCRAETRSQGIATKRKSKGGSWLQYLFPGDCNATLDTWGNLHYTWGKRGGLPATRRPVCRGLRHYKG
jgi:hypothetical protein